MKPNFIAPTNLKIYILINNVLYKLNENNIVNMIKSLIRDLYLVYLYNLQMKLG